MDVRPADGQRRDPQSYGSHINIAVSRATYDAMFERQPHLLHLIGSFLASNLICTGIGDVGEGFSISQRAPFMVCFLGVQTTERRPLVNSRDEALAGGDFAGDAARAAEALVAAARRQAALVRHDAAGIDRLKQRIPLDGDAVRLIPLFAEDVHEVESLRRMADAVFRGEPGPAPA